MKDKSKPLNILITGGAGFIGSHLAEALLAAGHNIQVIDDLSTGSLDNISHLQSNPKFHFAYATITDSVVMDRLASQSEVIIHLAAAVGVKLIVEKPVHVIETNVIGTHAVLKSALRYNCRVLLASTSEVYGKGNNIPFYEEDDVLIGATSKSRWAYAASKMIDEFLGNAYLYKYGLEVIPFRLFNTAGPRQTGHYGMVIPTFVRQALRGEPITVYGDGSQSRCFCDIRDVVKALMGLMTHPKAPGRVYNIGSTEEISILELAKLVKNITNSGSAIVNVAYADAYKIGFEDLQRRVPNISRIRDLLGWEPKYPLDEILKTVIEYESTKFN